MSDSRLFTGTDCNWWLVQVSEVRLGFLWFAEDPKEITAYYERRMAIAWTTFMVTMIALAALIIMASKGIGKMRRDTAGIMLFWAIAQIPFLVCSSLQFQVSDKVIHPDDIEFYPNLSLAWKATQQQLTIFLIVTIWMAVDTFVKMRLDFIDHQESIMRSSLEYKLTKSRKLGLGFSIANLLFQSILFGVVMQQTKEQIHIVWFFNEPQPFKQNTANLAVFVGLLVLTFIVIYVAIMVWQLVSILQTIQLSIRLPKMVNIALYVSVAILNLLYFFDVCVMMFWYWGAPAYKMTQFSDYKGAPPPWPQNVVNDDMMCFSYTHLGTIDDDLYYSEHQTTFGSFLRTIFIVSEVTPLIWTLVFAVCFLAMQYTSSFQVATVNNQQIDDENDQ